MLRIKECPEDFLVREIKRLELKDKGRYAYFLLWKRDMTTLEAIKKVSRELEVPQDHIGFGGLKDKRAITEQFISIDRPRAVRKIKEEGLKLRFLGWSDEPMSLGDIEGNQFEIKVMGASPKKLKRARRMMSFVEEFGFENYFGEQRFGSVKHSQDFILRHLLREDYEEALKEYLTSMKDKRRRKALLKNWKRWREFLKLMPQHNSIEAQLVKDLIKGSSFHQALNRLPKNIKLMFVFSYQSYLWNRYVSTFVSKYFKHCSVRFIKGRLCFITHIERNIFEEIRDLEVPYLGKEVEPMHPKIRKVIKDVLREEGLEDKDFEEEKIGIRLFSDGSRRLFAFPKGLKVVEEGNGYVRFSFQLPPGSYATILLRKLFCAPIAE